MPNGTVSRDFLPFFEEKKNYVSVVIDYEKKGLTSSLATYNAGHKKLHKIDICNKYC